MRKNIQHLQIGKREQFVTQHLETSTFLTAEGIKLKATYSEQDVENLEHLDFGAGFAPYLRGLNTTMYLKRPWTIALDAGFSTTEESTAFYKQNLAAGQKKFSLNFDLPTQLGYDTDEKGAAGDDDATSKIAIDTVEDMKLLFDEIPLNEIAVSLKINEAILPIMAFYIVAAEEQGIASERLFGNFQNVILKDIKIRNTPIQSKQSIKIISDLLEFANQKMPHFNALSISGFHIHKAGATADMELAFTLASGLEFVQNRLATGMKIDEIVSLISFSWGIGTNHFMEIAKLRAARLIWAKLMKQFNPKNDSSLALQTHCQTSSGCLILQDPFNTIVRTTIEAAATVFGGTQSLHIKAFEKSMALPTNFMTRMTLNTQRYLQEETKITKTVDPWAGSFYVESLTHEMTQNTWKLIEEIEKSGGMSNTIASGILKKRLEAVAARKQECLDNSQDMILEMKQNRLEKENPVQPSASDKKTIWDQQIEKLKQTKKNRNNKEVQLLLQKLSHCAQTGQGNLLEIAVENARNRATLGEISAALEMGFGKS